MLKGDAVEEQQNLEQIDIDISGAQFATSSLPPVVPSNIVPATTMPMTQRKSRRDPAFQSGGQDMLKRIDAADFTPIDPIFPNVDGV